MNTRAVWDAVRRLWEPPPEVPVRTVNETVIRGEASLQRTLQRLSRASGVLSLQSEDGAFDRAARLVEVSEAGLALQLQAVDGAAPGEVPGTLNVTACAEQGVLLFSVHEVVHRGQDRLQALLPQQIIQVQSRRHYRVTGLNGPRLRAELLLPGELRVLRLRNLSEEGVAYEMSGMGVPSGTVYADVRLRLDDKAISVPAMTVIYCRMHRELQCTVGAHFEGIGAEEARLLRRWIAAAQAAMASAYLDP